MLLLPKTRFNFRLVAHLGAVNIHEETLTGELLDARVEL